MKRIIFMGIAIMAIFVSSCKKEEVQAPETLSFKSKRLYEDIFIKAGKEHNKILNYVGENCVVENTSAEERFYIAKEQTNTETSWKYMQSLQNDIDKLLNEEIDVEEFMSYHLDFSDKDFILMSDSLNKIIHYALSKVSQSIEVTPDDYN